MLLNPFRIRLILSVSLIGLLCSSSQAFSQAVEVELERPGLVYCIGRVEQVREGSALIDLGDVHTLKVEQPLAVIRPVDGYFTPVGVLRVAESYSTFCRAYRSRTCKPEKGDVVMFVRQFYDLEVGGRHTIDFTKQQIIKRSGENSYSSSRRIDVARALHNYEKSQPKWERSRSSIVGYLNGASFAEGGEKNLKALVSHLNMIREHYRVGRNSLPAAGEGWVTIMPVMLGDTAIAQHESAQSIVVDGDGDPDGETSGPTIRDVQRNVKEQLFDSTEEERNLISFIIATALEKSPPKFDLWLQQQVEQSQFPELADEDVVLEVIRNIVQNLRDT